MEIFNPKEKILLHFEKLGLWLKGANVSPINVEISPSNKCNLNCSYCFYGKTHDPTIIDYDYLQNALLAMNSMCIKAITWTGGGEPTMHPRFDDMVHFANVMGFKQGLFTNGTNEIRNPEHFEWIRVSVSEDTLHRNFISEWAKKTTVGVCMSVTKKNMYGIPLLKQQAENAGAHYFQIRPALMPPNKDQLTLDKKIIFKVAKTGGNLKVMLTKYKWEDYCKPRGYDKCYGHVFTPFINSNGDVMSCAYHMKDPEYTFGNIYKKDFVDIWKDRDPDKIKIKDCQVCCKPHELNKRLYDLKHGKDKIMHIDFV